MSNFSRSKKYEDLHKEIQNDSESNIQSNELSQYANRLNEIDANNFDSMQQSAGMQGSRARTNEVNQSYQQPQQPMQQQYQQTPNQNYGGMQQPQQGTQADYMNEFISEVKDYNMKQGLRTVEDTQMNILNEIRSQGQEVPQGQQGQQPYADYHNPQGQVYNNPPQTQLNNPYQQQYQQTPNQNYTPYQQGQQTFPNQQGDPNPQTDGVVNIKNHEQISSEIERYMNDPDYIPVPEVQQQMTGATSGKDFDALQQQYLADLENERQQKLHDEILMETQQLKVQIEEYEDELEVAQEKVTNTNRLLNFILILLIFALFVILGIAVYWVLSSKGII